MARRLAFHGLLLFLLSMIEGMFVQKLAVPRMGLSAHVGGAMSGIFLMALAGIWPQVQLPPRAAKAAFWIAVVSFYLSSAGLFYAALFATHSSTPMFGCRSWRRPRAPTGPCAEPPASARRFPRPC